MTKFKSLSMGDELDDIESMHSNDCDCFECRMEAYNEWYDLEEAIATGN